MSNQYPPIRPGGRWPFMGISMPMLQEPVDFTRPAMQTELDRLLTDPELAKQLARKHTYLGDTVRRNLAEWVAGCVHEARPEWRLRMAVIPEGVTSTDYDGPLPPIMALIMRAEDNTCMALAAPGWLISVWPDQETLYTIPEADQRLREIIETANGATQHE